MYEVEASMRLAEGGSVFAFGTVTLEGCIRFGVQIRKYIDRETGEERLFLGMPRRERNGVWEDVVSPDKQMWERIQEAVMDSLKKMAFADFDLPEIEEVNVTRIHPHAPPGARACICGLATVRVCGVGIHGITVKKGENGLFVNMPQYQSSGGYKDAVYATNKRMQEKIQRAVLEEYAAREKEAQDEPGKI